MPDRLPVWFRQDLPDKTTQDLLCQFKNGQIHTVCQEARCPNINACFKQRTATFLILGNYCTRGCAFCAVKKASGPLVLDVDEPARVAQIIRQMGLEYAVITSVTRDDLKDGGACIFVQLVAQLRVSSPQTKVELLIPDFQGEEKAIKAVVNACPDVLGHNLETVPRLYPQVRPQADYQRSLKVLKSIKELNRQLITKSSLMLGLGESETELIEAMQELKAAGCDILVLGQYLAPSKQHYPVKEFVTPEKFASLAQTASNLGFLEVLSGPKMRSSFDARNIYQKLHGYA